MMRIVAPLERPDHVVKSSCRHAGVRPRADPDCARSRKQDAIHFTMNSDCIRSRQVTCRFGEGNMPRIAPAGIDGNSFQKQMGHCPEIVEKWFALDETMRFGGRLDPELKEEVRRSLAEGIGCRFCASLGAPDPDTRSARTALAVAFAETVFDSFGDLHGID